MTDFDGDLPNDVPLTDEGYVRQDRPTDAPWERVREALNAFENYATKYGSPVTIGEAHAALDRIEEEVKQSAYYRECRDKWREQAESLWDAAIRREEG